VPSPSQDPRLPLRPHLSASESGGSRGEGVPTAGANTRETMSTPGLSPAAVTITHRVGMAPLQVTAHAAHESLGVGARGGTARYAHGPGASTRAQGRARWLRSSRAPANPCGSARRTRPRPRPRPAASRLGQTISGAQSAWAHGGCAVRWRRVWQAARPATAARWESPWRCGCRRRASMSGPRCGSGRAHGGPAQHGCAAVGACVRVGRSNARARRHATRCGRESAHWPRWHGRRGRPRRSA
jgi:hypothetical protein